MENMKCPLCGNECKKEDLNTFLDYSDYLYSLLCVETVKAFERKDSPLGHLPVGEDKLELLRKCCETISNYAYQFDRRMCSSLDTPKRDTQ